jgi:hypothetical protein
MARHTAGLMLALQHHDVTHAKRVQSCRGRYACRAGTDDDDLVFGDVHQEIGCVTISAILPALSAAIRALQ